ncbi:MAG: tetratricopeptide repeat protein [Nostoc sp.]|uniref:tetratricopeptide repeat protein n=1 Tax=Nostoc sp. TaxID=1180 RepID=UPI002FFA381A
MNKRHASYKDGIEISKKLIEALFTVTEKCKYEELENYFKAFWVDKTPDEGHYKLWVRYATLKILAKLVVKNDSDKENTEAIRNAILCLSNLDILEDKRETTHPKNKTSSPYWHFVLKFRYNSDKKEENIEWLFGSDKEDGEWKKRQAQAKKSKAGKIYESTVDEVEEKNTEPEPIKLNPPYNLLFGLSVNFVGRENELVTLHKEFQKPGSIRRISAISGMGGVGKTELATQYARRYEVDYSGGICWLNARGSNLAAEIVKYATENMNLSVPQQDSQGNQRSLTEQVAYCWRNWQPQQGEVLVVIDDLTELADCLELLPESNRFRVLITTRVRGIDINIQEICLDVLSEEEALQLLEALLKPEGNWELEKAKELCEWLGYLPLGIELVGRYLKAKPLWDIARMLKELKAQLLENEAINPQEQKLQKTSLSTAHRGVKAAFELSWREFDEKTQSVAELLSLFAPKNIGWGWVKDISNLLKWVVIDVESANEQLYKFHFIQKVVEFDKNYKKSEYYTIHTLIREFLKIKLEASEEVKELKQCFVDIFVVIAKKISYSRTQEDIKGVKDAIPHLEEVAKNLVDVLSDENLIYPFISLGMFSEQQGLYKLAEPWYKECVLKVELRLGKEHPDFATSLNNLANIYRYQGDYSNAKSLYEEALALRKKLFGEEHPHIATSYNNLALLYKNQGQYKEAETLYVKVLAITKRLLGEKHPHTAINCNNLAALYFAQGRYKEAETLYVKVLAITKSLFGEKHPHIATCYNNLALLYKNQGRYKEAETLYVKALALSKSLFGEEHPDVATSYNNLAVLYFAQGQYSDAEPLLLKALKLRQKLLGEEHPDVASSYSNLALLYFAQGRHSDAEPLLLKALKLRQKLLGEKHPDVASSYNNLALFRQAQRRYTEAESLLLEALRIVERTLKETDPKTITVRKNLELLQNEISQKQPNLKLWEGWII